jgi:hypothetical protein
MGLSNNYTYDIKKEADGTWSVYVVWLKTDSNTKTHPISATF